MIDKAKLKDFISDLSKCIMSSSQSLEVTVVRVVSLSLFVCFTWFGWQNLCLKSCSWDHLSGSFWLQNGFLLNAVIKYFTLNWQRSR